MNNRYIVLPIIYENGGCLELCICSDEYYTFLHKLKSWKNFVIKLIKSNIAATHFC